MNRSRRSIQLAIALACTAPLSAVARADLLYNGNFDIGGGSAGPDGWTQWTFGSTAFAAYKTDPNDQFTFNHTPYVNAGNYGDWWTSGGGWFQVLPSAAGKAYSLDAVCATEGWDNAAGELRLIYLDETNTVIRQDVQHSAEYLANQPWTPFNLTSEAPAGTTQVKVEIATWGARGSVMWDNLSLVETHVWNVDSDGDWFNAANWLGGVPNGSGADAQLKNIITANHTITANAAVTVGSLRINNANAYTIGGTGSLTLQLATGDTGRALLGVQAGTQTIGLPIVVASDATFNANTGAALVIAGPLTVNAGKTVVPSGAGQVAYQSSINLQNGAGITFASPSHATALNLADNAVATVTTGGSTTMKFDAVSLNPAARLELNDNDLVTSTSKTTIVNAIRAARNGGSWDQPGITSQAAKNQPSHATTLGVLSGAEYTGVGGSGQFSGQPYAAADTLVKYTWYGDTDFNGNVNFDDYVRTDNGFNNHLSGWLNGDFDLNGTVNFDDYVLIDLAFNTQSGTLGRALAYLDGSDRSGAGMNDPALQRLRQHLQDFGSDYGNHFLMAVPEPTGIGAIALGGMALLVRGRRRR
jgi:hypothetical protein